MSGSSDTITFNCSKCGVQLTVPSALAGVSGPCPQCQATISAPANPAPAVAEPATVAPQSAPPSSPPPTQPAAASPPPHEPVPAPQQPPLSEGMGSNIPVSPQAQEQGVPGGNPFHDRPSEKTQRVPESMAMKRLAETELPPTQQTAAQQAPVNEPLPPQPQAEPVPAHNTRLDEVVSEKSSKSGFSKILLGLLGLIALLGLAWFFLPPEFKENLGIGKKAGKDPSEILNNNPDPTGPSIENPGIGAGPITKGPDEIDVSPNLDPGVPDLSLRPDPQGVEVTPDPVAKQEPETDPKPAEIVPPVEEPEIDEFPIDGQDSILAKPRTFLKNYLKAKKWEDLIPLTINGEKMRPRMAAYYKKNPYKPERIAAMDYHHSAKLPNSSYDFYLFQVATASNTASFPMTVEQTRGGLKTDWVTYIEFKDRLLDRFLAAPVFKPKGESDEFHVILRRAHYFSDKVPKPNEKWCFKINSPVPGSPEEDVFVPTFSKFGEEVERRIDWAPTYFPIVRLRWETDEKFPNQPYVRLQKIVKYNWRGHE